MNRSDKILISRPDSVRRYRVGALPAHRHGLTLAGQLASRQQPDRRRVPPLPPASINKVLRWELFDCWQDELELLQSLATSDGSWLDELLPCPPSPPSDSSAAPSLVASSEDDEDWGSPPSSPRVTPALVARLSAWIASSSQFAKSGRAEPLVEFLYYDDLGIGDDDFG